MTTNQTIDGVSLHWAEIEAAVWGAFADGAKDYRGCTRERLRELRALLDAPEQPKAEPVSIYQVEYLGDDGWYDVEYREYKAYLRNPQFRTRVVRTHPGSGDPVGSFDKHMEYMARCKGLEKECDNLCAQLAERDALLRGLVEYADGLLSDVNDAWSYAGSTGAKLVHANEDYAKAVALLSTSAEPKPQVEAVAVVLPDQEAMSNAYSACKYHAPHIFEAGWNACLDEVTRLNTK